MYSFEKLEVWKESKTLVLLVYEALKDFPPSERFALCDQIRRAVISVPSNIAEGSGRNSIKEKIHFIEIAYGSLMEVYCQLLISTELKYLSIEKMNNIKFYLDKVSYLLTGLRSSFTKKITI